MTLPNPNAKIASSYKSSSITTATPGQLVLMLYDGALKFMKMAEQGLTLTDPRAKIETVNNNLIKAQNILSELQSSLDMKVEGEFPKTMFKLYDFMIRQLQQANLKKDAEPIKVVHAMLKDVRDAWEEMLKKTDNGRNMTTDGQAAAATSDAVTQAIPAVNKVLPPKTSLDASA